MAHTKQRVGYFTFEGLDGPRRLFYFDEPLALGLLRVLERAANSAGGDGTSGELDPSVHKPEALEELRRRAARASREDLERAHLAYVDVLKRADLADIDAHVESRKAAYSGGVR